MFSTNSASITLSKRFWWVFAATLALLLIAAVANILGTTLFLIAVFVIVLGIIAVVRGRLHKFNISNRRAGAVVLLLGVYLLVLGVVTSITTDDDIPVAVAAGDPCELTGSINEHDSGTLYCIPSDADDLTWASAAEFTAHQKAVAKELEEAAQQEAQEAAEKHEQELTAAEKRAEAAETALQDLKDEAEAEAKAKAAEKADKEAADKAAAAKAEEEEERERERQQEAAQDTPAPAPAPAPESNNTGVSGPYKNCTEARAAGAAPVYRGEPGYGPHLDRDNDGIGCE